AKGGLIDTMLAVLLLLVLIGQAFGGERMSCEVQPVRGDGREWHYRTKIPGYAGDVRDDKCWYPGERMKPRGELYWDTDTTDLSAPPSDAVRPAQAARVRPKPLLSSSLTMMATLPSAGARSMVAEPLCPKSPSTTQSIGGSVPKRRARSPTK